MPPEIPPRVASVASAHGTWKAHRQAQGNISTGGSRLNETIYRPPAPFQDSTSTSAHRPTINYPAHTYSGSRQPPLIITPREGPLNVPPPAPFQDTPAHRPTIRFRLDERSTADRSESLVDPELRILDAIHYNPTRIFKISGEVCKMFLDRNQQINFIFRENETEPSKTDLTIRTHSGYKHSLIENFMTAIDDGYELTVKCSSGVPITIPYNDLIYVPLTIQNRQEHIYTTPEDSLTLSKLSSNPGTILYMARTDCEAFLKRNPQINFVFRKDKRDSTETKLTVRTTDGYNHAKFNTITNVHDDGQSLTINYKVYKNSKHIQTSIQINYPPNQSDA